MRDSRYKWWLLALLFGTFFLELGTRQIYNAVLPQLKLDFAHLGVTDAQLGLVGTVFASVFGFSLVGSGFAADFIGRKRTIVGGTLLFSVGIFLSGFASGLVPLVLFYGVLNAMGQCCVAPASYSLISQYHDSTTRSTAMAIFQAASYAGIVLCSVLGGAFADAGTGVWRWAFWGLGGLGIVWVLALQGLMRDTLPDGATVDEKPSMREAFAALLTKPTAMLIAVAFGMYMYATLGIRLWVTAFLSRTFEGVSLTSAAFHSVFWLNLGSFLGLFVTARLMDRIGRRRPSIRLEVSVYGFLLCILPILAVAFAPTFVLCCAALLGLGLCLGVYEAAHYPAMFDCIAPRYRSVTTGLTGCFAFVVGSAAPTVLGWMNECFSMRTAFASLSVIVFLGALILLPAVFKYFKRDYIPQ